MKLFFGSGKNRPMAVCTDVRDYLPENKRYQYKDGRSMPEAAKCWVAANGHLPESIAGVVGNSELISGHFEYPTPAWGGGISMTDIMAFVPNGVIAVQAKVDERFDDLVSAWTFKEEERNSRSPPHRTEVIQGYAKTFGVRSIHLLDVRYQLLHRTLCAALAAKKLNGSQAWMIVQAFPTPTAEGHLSNRTDFDHFVAVVGNALKIDGVSVRLAWVSEPPVHDCSEALSDYPYFVRQSILIRDV